MSQLTENLGIVDDSLEVINEACTDMDRQELQMVLTLMDMRLQWLDEYREVPFTLESLSVDADQELSEPEPEKDLIDYMYCWREGDTSAYAIHFLNQGYVLAGGTRDRIESVCGEYLGTENSGWYKVVGPDDPDPDEGSGAWWRVGDNPPNRAGGLCQRCRYGTKRSKQQRNSQ